MGRLLQLWEGFLSDGEKPSDMCVLKACGDEFCVSVTEPCTAQMNYHF